MNKKEKMSQKIIAKGNFKGIKWYIIENGLYNPMCNKWGIWYCSYIEPPVEMQGLDPNKLKVYPHGGITWRGYLPVSKNNDTYVWGWDYNHYDDISFSKDNLLETRFQVIKESFGIERVIDFLEIEIEEYIGGLLNEISYENIG